MNTHVHTVWSEGPRLLLTRPLLQYMQPRLSGAFKGPSKSVILAPKHSVTRAHAHTHTESSSWKELGCLSLSFSPYTRDDNLLHSPSVIGEPFILAINNISVGLWANSWEDREALMFGWMGRVVWCLGVSLLYRSPECSVDIRACACVCAWMHVFTEIGSC